jgi:hypothetical protein
MDQSERWQAKVIHAILTNIGPENRFGDAKDLALSAQASSTKRMQNGFEIAYSNP